MLFLLLISRFELLEALESLLISMLFLDFGKLPFESSFVLF